MKSMSHYYRKLSWERKREGYMFSFVFKELFAFFFVIFKCKCIANDLMSLDLNNAYLHKHVFICLILIVFLFCECFIFATTRK